ncbi:oxidoreductase [Amorphus sp. 3PC139-8]|uniref:oxidoreductase n=1 Tax=Amorphus sp. 3PC139-8 TaxID=2735676 RepID=UPI00345D15C3
MALPTDDPKVWLVTGCTSGFGRAIAEVLLEQGYRVIVSAIRADDVRNLAERYPETARAVTLDVTKPEDAKAAVALAEREFGRVDVLVNNAGFGFMGAVEESAPDEYRPMMEVNLFGAINMMQAVLPGMRARASGHIFSISSVGGFTASAAFGLYAASKFGIEGVSEALALEVAPLGIRVTVIEPGQFRTNFRGSSMSRAKQVIDAYAETTGKTRSFIDSSNGTQAGDPRKAAGVIISVAEDPNPPFRLPLGADAYARIRAKLKNVEADIARVEAQACDVNFEGTETTMRV